MNIAYADAKSVATVAVGINALDTVAVTTVSRQQFKGELTVNL